MRVFLTILCLMAVAGSQAMQPSTALTQPMGLVSSSLLGFGIVIGSTYCHELGHQLANTYALGIKSTIHFTPWPHCRASTFDNSSPAIAVVGAAGPAFGLASTLVFLKLANLAYSWGTSDTIINALKTAFQLPLFAWNKSWIVQGAATIALLAHIGSLYPGSIGSKKMDGEDIVTGWYRYKKAKK